MDGVELEDSDRVAEFLGAPSRGWRTTLQLLLRDDIAPSQPQEPGACWQGVARVLGLLVMLGTAARSMLAALNQQQVRPSSDAHSESTC
jgi:hypothetical protein